MEKKENISKITTPEPYSSQEQDTAALNRREFLKRAGRLTVYTPPALMLLMEPSYAKMAKSGGAREREIFQACCRRILLRVSFKFCSMNSIKSLANATLNHIPPVVPF